MTVIIFLILMSSDFLVLADVNDTLNVHQKLMLLLRADSLFDQREIEQASQVFESFKKEMLSLGNKNGNEKKFIKQVFFQTKKRFLKNYTTSANFSYIFREGSFDCLTGTTFLAFIYESLGKSYEVKETAAHTYLIVNLSEGGRILIESTAFFGALIEDEMSIRLKEQEYVMQKAQFQANAFNRSITLYQLMGLHFYNKAVRAINKKNYRLGKKYLMIALLFYKEDRIEQLLLTSSVMGKKDSQ